MNQYKAPQQSKEVDPRFQHIEGFRHTIKKVTQQRRLADHALNKEPTRPSRHDFARFAKKYSGETTDRNEKMYTSILSTLPGLVESRAEPTDQQSSFKDRQAAIMKKISFNNALRDSINANPRIEKSALTAIVKSAALFYQYPPNEIVGIERETIDTLRGMQHELAFESILWNLPEGFEVLETTDEDDAKGTDYRVKCPNGTLVSIDVKASQLSADRAYEKRANALARRGKTVPSNEIILYSGFTEQDFDPSSPWRPTYQATSELTPYVEMELLAASGENTPRHTTAIAK